MAPIYRIIACMSVSITLLHASVAHAQIPTTDIANIVQTTTTTAFENIEQTRSELAQEIQGVQQLVNEAQQLQYQFDQIKNMNGNYLKHMLLNDYQYRRARRLIPGTYQGIRDLHQKSAELARKAGLTRSTTERVADSLVAVSVGDAAITRADALITETEVLVAEIDKDTQLKASLDLANRLEAQSQLLNAEILRVQGVQLAAAGRQQLHAETQRQADVRQSKFLGFPRLVEE